VSFDTGIYLLKKDKAKALSVGSSVAEIPAIPTRPKPEEIASEEGELLPIEAGAKTIVLTGVIPPELWNKVGIRLIPKLRAGAQPTLGVNFVLELDSPKAENLVRDIQQALADLEMTGKIKVEVR
jgi:hypothetical protein